MTTSQTDLFDRVLHAVKGEEVSRQTWHLKDGTEKIVEVKSFGPQSWIQRVHERGILTPVQLLAIILFTLWDFREPYQEDEQIVADWHREFRRAIDSGEIVPRDRNSLLPVADPDGGNWVISLDEADAFVAARGMTWTCTETVIHLFNECFGIDRSPPATDAGANTGALAQPQSNATTTGTSGTTPESIKAGDSMTVGIVAADKRASPVGLPTPAVATAFDGIGGWSEEQWNKYLGNGVSWLMPARRQQGQRGKGRPSVWDPLHLAKLTVDHCGASVSSITAAFRKHPSLEPWRRQWDEYRIEINDWKSRRT